MKRFLSICVVSAAVTVTTLAAAQGKPAKQVIAHRGASGYLPEHTLEAYALAYAQGADYIEQDLVMTRDGHFICLHDAYLETTTNVEDLFPNRKGEDGRYLAPMFTLVEIKQLRVTGRDDGLFPTGTASFEIPTFEEAIELIQGLNKSLGRDVGIYPELKGPTEHREHGLPMEEKFLEVVKRYGYAGPNANIFVQCFVPDSLVLMRKLGSKLPQIQLIGDDERCEPLMTKEGLAQVAAYAQGIGPDKELLLKRPDLAKWAKERGLLMHPYTFRASDVPSRFPSYDAELKEYYLTIGVDALFTDFPDKTVAFLESAELR